MPTAELLHNVTAQDRHKAGIFSYLFPLMSSAGTSPVTNRTHTKTKTRKERSLAAHEELVEDSTCNFQKRYLNLPAKATLAYVVRKVSGLVGKVQTADTQEAYRAVPALLNAIAVALGACSRV